MRDFFWATWPKLHGMNLKEFNPHLRLLVPATVGDLLFYCGRSRRVVKVKQRGSYWLVWLA